MSSDFIIAVFTPLVQKATLLWASAVHVYVCLAAGLKLLLSQRTRAVRFPLGGGVYLLYSVVSRASELNFQEAG